MGKILIGTSGWNYKHWAGKFYPQDLNQRKWLEFYTQHFPTVEINMSFYRFPNKKMVSSWVNRTPEDFIFSLKANRLFTHLKRLQISREEVKKSFSLFLETISKFKEKLGVIFFQLPPGFKRDDERLKNFLKELPRTFRFAFEFRNPGWFAPEVFALLEKQKIATVVVSAPGVPFWPVKTSDFAYFRLHGASKWYNYKYTEPELKELAGKIKEFSQTGDVLVYFDNDTNAWAVEDAKRLREILGLS